MTAGVAILAQAFDFAARAHVDQRRKGAAQEPYMNHLTEVVALLSHSSHGNDVDLLAAGALHDAVEDAGVTLGEIEERFGPGTASIVAEVTDDKSMPKPERKRRQVETAAHKSVSARLLKIADKTSNLRSLVASPPASWDRKRLEEYADWAEQVVAQCRNLDPFLEARFDEALDAARQQFKSKSKRDKH